MRLAVPIAMLALAAALLGGCGSSASNSADTGPGAAPPRGAATAPAGASAQSCGARVAETGSLRATGVSCAEAKAVLLAWQRDEGCVGSQGISHIACTVRSYRCVATRTDRGLAVSCARPGHSVAFISRR